MARVFKYVAAGGAGAKDGAAWSSAYDEAAFETAIESGSLATDTIFFIKSGTYTLDSAYVMSVNGGYNLPIVFIGVLSTTTNEGTSVVYSDWAFGTDRPLFACAAYSITLTQYVYLKNIRFTTTANPGITMGGGNLIHTCKFTNGYNGSGQYAIVTANGFNALNCEFEGTGATKSSGVSGVGTSSLFVNCYFNALNYGINFTGAQGVVLNCIFNTCVIGVEIADRYSMLLVNNTFSACGTAVHASTAYRNMFINNLLEGCTTGGFVWTTQIDGNIWWENHGNDARNADMFNKVADTTVHQDYALTSGDPLFVTAGSNFQLQAGSPCLLTGVQNLLAVG